MGSWGRLVLTCTSSLTSAYQLRLSVVKHSQNKSVKSFAQTVKTAMSKLGTTIASLVPSFDFTPTAQAYALA